MRRVSNLINFLSSTEFALCTVGVSAVSVVIRKYVRLFVVPVNQTRLNNLIDFLASTEFAQGILCGCFRGVSVVIR